MRKIVDTVTDRLTRWARDASRLAERAKMPLATAALVACAVALASQAWAQVYSAGQGFLFANGLTIAAKAPVAGTSPTVTLSAVAGEIPSDVFVTGTAGGAQLATSTSTTTLFNLPTPTTTVPQFAVVKCAPMGSWGNANITAYAFISPTVTTQTTPPATVQIAYVLSNGSASVNVTPTSNQVNCEVSQY